MLELLGSCFYHVTRRFVSLEDADEELEGLAERLQ